ncbi:MAG: dienelactone hydrolase family protein [Sulfuriflexus sp.]|nr:dienelactone hydrolase family protein [Sulfuriflexus sp.]
MNKILQFLICSLLLSVSSISQAANEYPWWWNSDWWEQGQLEVPVNHKVKVDWVSVDHDDNEIPVMVARPDDDKKYPAILFQHGRRGLDDLIQLHVKRLAARGFVVVAGDVFKGRLVDSYPIGHDYALEGDVNQILTYLLSRKDISSKKACSYSHTRGGYYTLKVAVKFKRQEKDLACYVSYYPHMQDPNLPEPAQVYQYAVEASDMKLPTLIFIGEKEQYQRRRPIEAAIKVMQENKVDARLIIYPGVGRGFDFRPDNVRNFADDLASKDAIQRATHFMNKYLMKK